MLVILGVVAAQSGTREERGLIRGGMLTHMVSSALRGAADFCLGALEQEAAQARVAQAGARLAEVAEALGGDEPLLAEVALMDQLGLNITERGLEACHSR